jgi:hypothetical protein
MVAFALCFLSWGKYTLDKGFWVNMMGAVYFSKTWRGELDPPKRQGQ